MDECQIWIFAKSHAIEIKRDLQSLLGFYCNIMTVLNAANDLAEALYSKKEILRHLSRKDHIIIIGGLDGRHLNDNRFGIKDFCISLQNINIILCDETFSDDLKSIEQRCHHVRCVVYRKYSPAEDIVDCVCRLLQKEIRNFAPKHVDNNYDIFSQPGPSTSFPTIKEKLNAVYGSAGDTGSSNSYAPERNTAFNAYGDTKYNPSPSTENNLKRPREAGAKPKSKTKPKSIYRTRSILNIAHQNINGLMAKEGKLINKINEMSRMNIDLDVICLTEHNMVDEDVDEVDIPNYELAHTIIRDERQGGTTILVRDDLKFRVLPKVEVNNHPEFLECCAIKLVDLEIIIICVYRPPRYNRRDIDEFLDELDVMLRRYKKQKVIICGDFNIDILKDDKSSREFQEVVSNYKMSIAVRSVTRIGSNSCIDNIIHNMPGTMSRVMDWKLSDHTAQLLICSLK